MTAREYLSYISECAGGFAFIGRDGKLYIRTIYQDEQEIPLELFGEYKWGDKCTISKVSYENGVESFKFGNDTGNNLWLNQENMYIVDEEEVENIYNEIKDLEAYSFEGKTIIDPALDVGDKITIDNKSVIYQGEMDFQTRFIAEISSKIAIKEKQETTVKETSQKVINRRVQSRIDEAEGKITQLIEENSETSQKITEVEQTVEGITQTVSEVKTESIYKVDVMYALSDSSSQAPTTGWQTTAPQWQDGKYMWQKTVTTYGNGSTEESNATCITGAKGQNGANGTNGTDGEKGDTGIGVQEIIEQYYLSDSDTTQTGGSWKETQDIWTVGKYIWTRNKITWTDDTVTYTTPVLATGINNANSVANTAKDTVDNTNNNLTNNYYTKTETDTKINQTAESIEMNVHQEISNITGENSVINGSFEQDLEYWTTTANQGMAQATQYNNKKYAELITMNGATTLSQYVKGLMNGVGYELSFDVLSNSFIPSTVTFTVTISQTFDDTEEITTLKTQQIELSSSEKNVVIAFNPTYTSDVNIEFRLNASSYMSQEVSAMIANVVVAGGSISERFAKLNLDIQGIELEVSEKVGEDEIGTLIQQNAESIRIAWNQISQFLKLEGNNGYANLNIYDGNNNLLMTLNSEGQAFYRDSTYIGKIGTNKMQENNSQKGLTFDLTENGSYMTWEAKENASENVYTMKLSYVKDGVVGFNNGRGIYVGDKLFLQGNELNFGGNLSWQNNLVSINNNSLLAFNVNGNRVMEISDYGVYINGTLTADNVSDGRLKKDIYKSSLNAIEIIKQIKHREFTWKKDQTKEKVGYIAQELEEIDSNYIKKMPQKDEDGNIIDYIYSINELALLATATKAIQEQQTIIEQQQKYIDLILEKLQLNTEKENKKEKIKNKKEEIIFNDEIKYSKIKKIKPKEIKFLRNENESKLVEEEENE